MSALTPKTWETFNRDYKQVQRIGRGASGEVHKMRKEESGQEYAAKYFYSEVYNSHVNFFNEQTILRKLWSNADEKELPYVVRPFWFFTPSTKDIATAERAEKESPQ